MIPVLDAYQFSAPATLAEALDDLARHPQARPFAGGTDLMVLLEAGQLPADRYVSLANCRGLRGIDRTPEGGLSIGALSTYTDIRRSALVADGYTLLQRAAAETGGIATQNRGTIGGNIGNASPAADTPPVLLVYDAELELLSSSGTRRVPYLGFHRGYKQIDLRPGEIIARVILPAAVAVPTKNVASAAASPADEASAAASPGDEASAARPSEDEASAARSPENVASGFRSKETVASAFRRNDMREYYRKVGTRRAQAISKVCLAATMAFEDDVRGAGRRDLGGPGAQAARVVNHVRIALGSVAPTVIRATRTEDVLRGRVVDEDTISEAQRTLAAEIAPIDDIRSTARYRAHVAASLLRDFLTGAAY